MELSSPLPAATPAALRYRTARVTGAVLLVHLGAIWWLGHSLLSAPQLDSQSEHVIMASVVTEMLAPLPASTPAPQPVAAKVPTPTPAKPQAQPQATPPQRPSPVPSPTTAEAAPSAPAASPATAIAPTANPRPSNPAPAPVVLPSSDADYLNNPAPMYPRMSRRMGEQGTVTVRVLISPEGRAEQAEVRTSSGYPRLDEAALDTVKRWRYVPGKRAGVPEAMWFNVPIRFVLD